MSSYALLLTSVPGPGRGWEILVHRNSLYTPPFQPCSRNEYVPGLLPTSIRMVLLQNRSR